MEENTVVAFRNPSNFQDDPLTEVYPELRDELAIMDGVDEVLRVSKPYKLSSREGARGRHRGRTAVRRLRRRRPAGGDGRPVLDRV